MFDGKNLRPQHSYKISSIFASFFFVGSFDRREVDRTFQEANKKLDVELDRSENALRTSKGLIEKLEKFSTITPAKSI